MHRKPAGIRAIAVDFPSVLRTNDYWRVKHPELVARTEDKTLARAFSPVGTNARGKAVDLWVEAMSPHTRDPFRGTVERRVLGPGESSIVLETRAARAALEAARLAPEEVDLMIVGSMFPDQPGPGNAAYVAGELGLRGAAWNLGSACASAQVSLQIASNLVRTGEYRNALVVTSCTYSRFCDTEDDTLSFSCGDGASAFVVGEVGEGQGLLGTRAVNASATCGMFFVESAMDRQGKAREIIKAGKNAGKLFPELASAYAEECCHGALAAAGVTVDDIDLFVFYSATAWQSRFTAQVLGVDPARVFDLFTRYANISAASIPVHLHHAAAMGRLRPGDLVLAYGHGFVGSAAAVVMRWGDVALGPMPTPSEGLQRDA